MKQRRRTLRPGVMLTLHSWDEVDPNTHRRSLRYRVIRVRNSTEWFIGQMLTKRDVEKVLRRRRVEVVVTSRRG